MADPRTFAVCLATVDGPSYAAGNADAAFTIQRQVGIATYSPPLDPHGNRVRGVRVCERHSGDMGLHLMDTAPPADSGDGIGRPSSPRGPR